jgi:hydrogenase expression/formation protein HypE
VSDRFPVGKLPHAWLARMLDLVARPDPRVLIGPAPGEDAAVLEWGDRALVVTTDPVTFATDRIGWYAVHINANDVAVMGATPRWFFATLLLPERGATEALLSHIVDDIRRTCDTLGVTVCGGHTEITAGMDRPIVVGQMLGEAPLARIVRKTALEPGDRILLARAIAIEGTAILAREHARRLAGRIAPDLLARAAGFLDDPGLSVVSAASAALEAAPIRALHDPTEGGLASGLVELATAAGVGLVAYRDRVPIYPETQAICTALGLDPLCLIASGALLIGVPATAVPAVVDALADRGIPAREIARALPPEDGLWWEDDEGRREPLEPPPRDEIARLVDATGD